MCRMEETEISHIVPGMGFSLLFLSCYEGKLS